MLPIVSILLNENIILLEIDKSHKVLDFSGRSEIVRASIRNLLAEEKDRDGICMERALYSPFGNT